MQTNLRPPDNPQVREVRKMIEKLGVPVVSVALQVSDTAVRGWKNGKKITSERQAQIIELYQQKSRQSVVVPIRESTGSNHGLPAVSDPVRDPVFNPKESARISRYGRRLNSAKDDVEYWKALTCGSSKESPVRHIVLLLMLFALLEIGMTAYGLIASYRQMPAMAALAGLGMALITVGATSAFGIRCRGIIDGWKWAGVAWLLLCGFVASTAVATVVIARLGAPDFLSSINIMAADTSVQSDGPDIMLVIYCIATVCIAIGSMRMSYRSTSPWTQLYQAERRRDREERNLEIVQIGGWRSWLKF